MTTLFTFQSPISAPPTPRDRKIRHRPATSSPLSWNYPSSPTSSPSDRQQHNTTSSSDRRRSQYKSQGSARNTPRVPSSPGFNLTTSARTPNSFSTPKPHAPRSEGDISPSSILLRSKLKAKVLEKAVLERRKRLTESQRRLRDVPRRLELSSDGFDVEDVDMSSECEDEDGGEVDYEDELVTRILSSVTRRETAHRYRYTYARDIGSSDPAYEDPDQWEEELNEDLARLEELDALDEDEELAAYAADAPDEFDEFDVLEGLTAEELEAIGMGAGQGRGDDSTMDMS